MRKIALLVSFLTGVACMAAPSPAIFDGGVANGASFEKGQMVSPGSIVSIFGTALADSLQQGDTIPLSTSLGSASVTMNGITAPLYFVSDGQINAQVPYEILPGGSNSVTANVVVTHGGVASPPMAVQVGLAAPGIFSFPPGVGWAIAINRDSSLAAPANAIHGISTHPAKAGDVLELLATGLGEVDPPGVTGAASLDKLRRTTQKPVVWIGGQSATVQFSGLSPQFPGVYQLNVVVPQIAASDSVPIQIDMNGIKSTDKVTIAVQ